MILVGYSDRGIGSSEEPKKAARLCARSCPCRVSCLVSCSSLPLRCPPFLPVRARPATHTRRFSTRARQLRRAEGPAAAETAGDTNRPHDTPPTHKDPKHRPKPRERDKPAPVAIGQVRPTGCPPQVARPLPASLAAASARRRNIIRARRSRAPRAPAHRRLDRSPRTIAAVDAAVGDRQPSRRSRLRWPGAVPGQPLRKRLKPTTIRSGGGRRFTPQLF